MTESDLSDTGNPVQPKPQRYIEHNAIALWLWLSGSAGSCNTRQSEKASTAPSLSPHSPPPASCRAHDNNHEGNPHNPVHHLLLRRNASTLFFQSATVAKQRFSLEILFLAAPEALTGARG